jgi:hypothetical protein
MIEDVASGPFHVARNLLVESFDLADKFDSPRRNLVVV